MQVGILKTDGGTHPADKWAWATATHLVSVDPNADALIQRNAATLQLRIAEALEGHHGAVQKQERAGLRQNGDDHLATAIDPLPFVEQALADIVAVAKGSRWEPQFNDPAIQDQMRAVLATHFATSQHIERSWHAGRSPDGPNARAFLAAHHPGAK